MRERLPPSVVDLELDGANIEQISILMEMQAIINIIFMKCII